MSSVAAVEATGLKRSYKSGEAWINALNGVNLSIQPGEFVCVMGRSGSGKSTLLNVLGALDRPDQGHVRIQGQDLMGLADSDLAKFRRRNLGFIFQFFNLMPTLTAAENVALPLLLDGVNSHEAFEKAKVLLARMELGDRTGHRPAQLSGGQMQRVAIARALVSNPALLLADEPTGNLDSAIGKQILGILRDLAKKDNQTIVLVTHDPASAAFADRLIIMSDGHIESDKRL